MPLFLYVGLVNVGDWWLKQLDEFLTGLTPFEAESENPMDTYEKIMKGKYVVYAETSQAQDLIAGLLCVQPSYYRPDLNLAHLTSAPFPF